MSLGETLQERKDMWTDKNSSPVSCAYFHWGALGQIRPHQYSVAQSQLGQEPSLDPRGQTVSWITKICENPSVQIYQGSPSGRKLRRGQIAQKRQKVT